MPNLGGWEWVILAVVALLLFGGTRLAGVGKSAGKAIREFKEEVSAGPEKPEVEAKEDES
jgi:sec-independent protein translocase protein TatA